MKLKSKFFTLVVTTVAAMGLSSGACSDDNNDEVSVSRSSIEMPVNGGSEQVEIMSNTAWTISNKPLWITLTHENGKGDKTVTITATRNTEIESRQALLLIQAGDAEASIQIIQAGRDAELKLNPTSLTFEAKSGDTKSFNISSDNAWTISHCPSWLTPSTQSGNSGSVDVTLTTSSANDTSEALKDSVVISDGTISAKLTVEQLGGRTPDCKTSVANILRMSDDICFNYECGKNVKFFYDRLFVTQSMKLRTESEIIASVQNDADMWSRTSAIDAAQPTCYASQLSPGTSYTLVTVSYDHNDRLGEIVKKDIITKTSVNQPEVNGTRLYFKGSGYNSYYGVEVEKGDNGYCSKYYVWAAAGELQTSWMFADSPAVLAWYLKREIAKNPTSHATNINAQTDALLTSWGYTLNDGTPIASSGREYLEGPMSQEVATFEKLRHGSDDESIQIVAWGMDVDGEFSGKIFSYLADLSDFSSPKNIQPRQRNTRVASTVTSFKSRHLPVTNGLKLNVPWQ